VTFSYLQIAQQFSQNQIVTDIGPLGNGLINDTFLVKTNATSFVLQRINRQVFPEADLIIDNLLQLNRHIRLKNPNTVKLTIPALLKTHKGLNAYHDNQQDCWRALQLIEHSESRESISHKTEAKQIGFALAHFHRLFSDLKPQTIHDTLPGFHVTPRYLQQYHHVADQIPIKNQSEAFEFCSQFIENFAGKADTLEKARQAGLLSERIIHGDPKLNNFLFAKNTHTIISIIDLDTVKPGLVHYDLGDCLRSCCHIRESDSFDVGLCEVILTSYLQEAGHFFTAADYDYLYAAIELIPFELGLRFFTDYLAGDQYFKVDQAEQNLYRAKSQFELCTDIARQRLTIEKIIRQLQKTI
jgi:Ser/Thr protein kinase RdoA (MazF antagonist)